MTFENLNLIEPLLKALKGEGYSNPTPIQEKAIPVILERKDVLGSAQTGTGKTAAFALPILQILNEELKNNSSKRTIRSIILTPTRELALQIGDNFKAYGKYINIKHTVIFGGVNQKSQTDALRAGIDVLIATPGRLLDLIDQKYINLKSISIFVLDEADRMLDMGFIHDVKKVISFLPERKQTLLFSATMPKEISVLADKILVKPVKIAVNPVSSTVDSIEQSLYFVDKKNKRPLLIHLLNENQVSTALIFTRTKHGADKLAKDLNKAGILADSIHGNKSQPARQRALVNFKSGKTRALVATDIAARGIDIEELSHVINFEIPNVAETYIHRIGRTGRAGLSGIALSFCDAEEKDYLKDIHKLISKQIKVVENHPFRLTENSSSEPTLNKNLTFKKAGFHNSSQRKLVRKENSYKV